MKMQIIHNCIEFPDDALDSVIALGNFDGVHKGHGQILAELKRLAEQANKTSAVMTFEPHPRRFFAPESNPFRLTSLEQKSNLIEKAGIDYLFVIDFDQQFANISPEEFVEEILVNKLKASHIITGYDFTFGKNRQGDTGSLQEYSGFDYTKIDEISDNGQRYSSSNIRKYLQNAQIKQANEMLGHGFKLKGRVLKGEALAAKLGFPTANIDMGEYIRPAYGVYAVKIKIDGKIHKAVANIGVKPTFKDKKELLEVHVFDFNHDIYGKEVEVELVDFIRQENKFNSIEDLKAQITKDCAKAKEALR